MISQRSSSFRLRQSDGLERERESVYFRWAVLALLRAGAAVKVLTHKEVNDKNVNPTTKENMTLNDYMIDIVNNGGWDAHAKKHQDRLLGVVSRCAEELPREILRIIVSFWALPH